MKVTTVYISKVTEHMQHDQGSLPQTIQKHHLRNNANIYMSSVKMHN